MQKSIYRPRYKIAFQAKSIVWPYKNSRLRRFFNIRGRKLIRRGFFTRYFLVLNSMKWVIARRFIQPYKVLKSPNRWQYKKLFYTKQQIRHFYGKVKEQRFRNFFKKFLSGVTSRNKSFYSLMELRLDMVVFRLKFMPTIYAAHQLVLHHGILVNKGIKTSPNNIVRVGDIIGLSKNQWSSIFCNFYLKSYYRSFGKWTLKLRQKKLLRKKSFWLFKRIRFFKRKNLIFLRKTFMTIKYCFNLKKNFSKHFSKLHKILMRYAQDSEERNGEVSGFINKIGELKQNFNKIFTRFLLKIKKLNQWKDNQKSLFSLQNARGKQKSRFFAQKQKTRFFLQKWRWNGYFKKFVKWIATLFVEYKNLYFFKTLFSIQKIKVLTFIEEQREFVNPRRLLLYKRYERWYLQKYVLFQQKLSQYYFFFLRTRSHMKKKVWRSFLNKHQHSKAFKPVKWRAALSYFMIYKKLKKKRRLLIPRLKKVHWYFPQYFYFDVKTLRGVVLRNPMSNEIFYSFRGSLSNIYSFYKSRGY